MPCRLKGSSFSFSFPNGALYLISWKKKRRERARPLSFLYPISYSIYAFLVGWPRLCLKATFDSE